ncbi:MAG: tRNA lysidine(34) synthetase TilS [Paracoccaceae bacterium]
MKSEVALSLEMLFGAEQPARLGIAVSGGGDSTALLHCLVDWSKASGVALHAVTVDHGLRAGAADEIHEVQRLCTSLGIAHDVLHWTGWNGEGNLQDAARRARYRLMAQWSAEKAISDVALGHTLDDQAETVLMRLARGSGVDGLSGMAASRSAQGIRWLRPLLGIRRADLRDYLRKNRVTWSEDPSNEDAKFDRIKTRTALKTLGTLGITPERLADTAIRMASARQVLDQSTQTAAQDIAKITAGAVHLQLDGLFHLPAETRRRLLVHSLSWVASADYPPRHAALSELQIAMTARKTATLHGCLISSDRHRCLITRELSAVAHLTVAPGQIWDNRWKMSGPVNAGHMIRVLGENGLKSCPNWRETGLDRAVVLASPAVWNNQEMVAAPVAGHSNQWQAELIHSATHFQSSILSH